MHVIIHLIKMYINKNKIKTLVSSAPAGFFVAFIFGVGVVYASAIYSPGETLNPNCFPTDPNCTVTVPSNNIVSGNAIGDMLSWNGVSWSSVATSTLGLGGSIGSVNGLLWGTNGVVSSISTSSLLINTNNLVEGSNLFFTDVRASTTARSAISSSAVGLSYTPSTGVISLTSGYNIPLDSSTTNWNNFYDTPSSRISAGSGLSWSGNTLNAAIVPSGWTSGNGLLYNSTSTDMIAIGSTTAIATLNVRGNGSVKPFVVASSSGAHLFTILADGSIGIGSSTPSAKLSVSGNAYVDGNLSATGATRLLGSVYLGNLTGPLHAINGLISTSSVLVIANGGTGSTNIIDAQKNLSITGGVIVKHRDGSQTVYSASYDDNQMRGFALTTAVGNIATGDKIILSCDIFDLDYSPTGLDLSKIGTVTNTSIEGCGKYSTTITTSATGGIRMITVADKSRVSNLNLVATGVGDYVFPIYGSGVQNVVISDVAMSAYSDGLFFDGDNTVSVYNTNIVSAWDSVMLSSGTLNIYDSKIIGNDQGLSNTGIVASGNTASHPAYVNIYNTDIDQRTSNGVGIIAQSADAHFNVYNGSILATNTSIFNGSGGTVSISAGTVYNPDQVSGPLTYLDSNQIAKSLANASVNVGIGTTTPLSKLTVYENSTGVVGNIKTSIGDFRWQSGASGEGATMAVARDGGKFAAIMAGTNGSIFSYDSSGFFGIGNQSNDSFYANHIGTGSSPWTTSYDLWVTPHHVAVNQTSAAVSTFDVKGNVSIGSYAGVSVAPTDGLIVSGKAGFGTLSPKTPLHVSLTSSPSVVPSLGAYDNTPFYLTNTDSAYGLLAGVINSGTAWLQVQRTDSTATAYNLSLQPNGGNVGIGTTTPTAVLHVAGTMRNSTFGTGNLQSDASGNITVSSDERLKDMQGNFNRGLSDILTLNPILYKWKDTTGYDTVNTYAGFSAQNVQLSIPEAVGQDSNGMLTLSDRPILATLVNAIKELNTTVNTKATTTTQVGATTTIVQIIQAPEIDTTSIASTTADILANSDSFFGGLWDAFIKRLSNFGIVITESYTKVTNLFVRTIHIEDKLCVDDVCVSKDQLKAMLIKATATTTEQHSTTTPVLSTTTPIFVPNIIKNETVIISTTTIDLTASTTTPIEISTSTVATSTVLIGEPVPLVEIISTPTSTPAIEQNVQIPDTDTPVSDAVITTDNVGQ